MPSASVQASAQKTSDVKGISPPYTTETAHESSRHNTNVSLSQHGLTLEDIDAQDLGDRDAQDNAPRRTSGGLPTEASAEPLDPETILPSQPVFESPVSGQQSAGEHFPNRYHSGLAPRQATPNHGQDSSEDIELGRRVKKLRRLQDASDKTTQEIEQNSRRLKEPEAALGSKKEALADTRSRMEQLQIELEELQRTITRLGRRVNHEHGRLGTASQVRDGYSKEMVGILHYLGTKAAMP